MKNSFLTAAMFSTVALVSCSKNESNNSEKSAESYTYRATDGSRAKVIFSKGKNPTLSIQANGQKFLLDLADADESATVYERNGITAISKGDSILITQGENIIPLVKDK